MFEKLLSDIINNKNIRENLIEIKSDIKTPEGINALRKSELYRADIFSGLLKSEDPKIRKNAALIMGKLKEAGYEDLLFAAYESEDTFFVKSTYVSALAEFKSERYKDRFLERKKELETGSFGADIKHAAAELNEIIKLLATDDAHKKHIFVNPKEPVNVVFSTSKEMIPQLCGVLGDNDKVKNVTKVFCGALCKTSDIKALLSLRIYREILFPVNAMKTFEKNELPKALASGDLLKILDALHKESGEPYYFRMTSKSVDVSELATRLQALSGGRLINSPSDYEVELKLFAKKDNTYGVFLKLHTIEDRRFLYRKEYVAASMKPVNAAIMMWLCRDYFKRHGQILDPFCGVGTLLIERNRICPADYMYGIDTFGQAIAGARINTELAGCEINYINKNYFDFEHEYKFDEIITDMPVVAETETASFYKNFFEKTKGVLRDSGYIIMYSKEENIIKNYIKNAGKYMLVEEFVIDVKNNMSVFIIQSI